MPPNVKPNHDHHNDTLALLQRLTLSDYPARRPTKLVKRMPNMDTSDGPAIDQIATHSHTPNLQQHNQPPLSNLSFTTSTTPTARPGPPSRNASYSKRHASFDTPREIPLPSPSASEVSSMAQYFPFIAPNASTAPRRNSQKSVSTDGQQDSNMGESLAGKEEDDVYMREMGIVAERDRYAAVFEDGYDSASMLSGSSGSSSGSPAPSIAPSELSLRHQKACGSPRVRPYPPPQLHAHGEEGSASSGKGKGKEPEKEKEAGQVFPFARPYSLPHNHSSSSNSSTSTQTGMPAATPSGLGGDRSSTASLPLPKQTPFRTLPTVQAQSPMQEEPPIELSQPPIEQPQPEPPLHLRPQTQPAPPRPRALDASVPSSFTIPPLPVPQRRARPQAVSSAAAAASSSTTLMPATAYPHGAMSRSLSVDPEAAAPYSGAPEPPTILSEAANAPSRTPFLCAQPLAVEHAVTVETARNAYTLLIRLPGFRRDAITLASRKRRVLHVVADDWTPGSGGHFERKVSFGWDAELGSVRAEFDGDVLRVVVPRRVPQVW